VLFVDEAYRLSEGHFAKEAMDELVGLLTQETFRGKLIVIIAGYDQEMDQLLAVNPGLSSRFPNEIVFNNLPPGKCLEVLRRELEKSSVTVAALEKVNSEDYKRLLELVRDLSSLPSWGNARDIITLAKDMVAVAFTRPEASDSNDSDLLSLSAAEAIGCIERMLTAHRSRNNLTAAPPRVPDPAPEQIQDRPPPTAPAPPRIEQAKTIAPPRPQPIQEHAVVEAQAEDSDSGDEATMIQSRDPGVTDMIWNQLQADKRAQEERELDAQAALKSLMEKRERERNRQQRAKALRIELEKRKAVDDEAKRKWEEARLKELKHREELARREAALAAKRKEEEERRKKEQLAQAKLRTMGVCVAGFQWIKQSGGYRCAGGSHYVSDAALGI
jgi:hypothetical protein